MYETQFGHLKRPTHFNTSWDQARFEVIQFHNVHSNVAIYTVCIPMHTVKVPGCFRCVHINGQICQSMGLGWQC